jgi:small subunit ribosomal protein S6e
MATFNVVVSDPETGQSFTREIEGQDANRFMGREVGESVDGTAVGLDGFTVEITGGSDDAGRPMRPDVRGPDLKEILLEGGTGYKPTREGERKRVTVRGREVSDAIAQLNVKVVEGEGSVAVALGEAEPEEVEDAEPADAEDEEAAEDEEEAAEAEADEEEAEAEDEADEEPEDEETAEEEEAEDEEEEGAEEEADEEEAEAEDEAEDEADEEPGDEETAEDEDEAADEEAESEAGEEEADAEAEETTDEDDEE